MKIVLEIKANHEKTNVDLYWWTHVKEQTNAI